MTTLTSPTTPVSSTLVSSPTCPVFEKVSDDELFSKAKFFGGKALYYRQKFIGLLPEVNKRRLYERRGFGSIFEFAFKLAGLSEQQVRTTLNLEKRFTDKPALKALLEDGTVSVNKLTRVAFLATSENEGKLAQAVQLLSKNALETFVRDERIANQNGLGEPLFKAKVMPGHDHARSEAECALKLSDEVTEKLLELQEKGIDINELLLDMLNRREQEIAEEKMAICEGLETAKSDYVPVRTRKVLSKENGTKCSIQTCKRPATELHHTQTFALSKMHDPHYLAPLCREHHQIAHTINLNFHAKRRQAVL